MRIFYSPMSGFGGTSTTFTLEQLHLRAQIDKSIPWESIERDKLDQLAMAVDMIATLPARSLRVLGRKPGTGPISIPEDIRDELTADYFIKAATKEVNAEALKNLRGVLSDLNPSQVGPRRTRPGGFVDKWDEPSNPLLENARRTLSSVTGLLEEVRKRAGDLTGQFKTARRQASPLGSESPLAAELASKLEDLPAAEIRNALDALLQSEPADRASGSYFKDLYGHRFWYQNLSEYFAQPMNSIVYETLRRVLRQHSE